MTTARRIVLALTAAMTVGLVAHAASLPTARGRLTTASVAATVPLRTCSPAASADTYADAAFLLTNFGTAATLDIRSFVALNKRSFIRFDLASCGIPAAARIVSAQLKLTLAAAPGSNRTYDVHRVTEAWTETGLTWSAQPAAAATATAGVASGTTAGVVLTAAVTADVAAFVAGTAPNQGWRVKDRTEDDAGPYDASFASREDGTASRRPALEVAYYP